MRNVKKISLIAIMIFVIGATSAAVFAASSYGSPAEAIAGITGRSVESVIDERNNTGKTFGMMAVEADKWDEFRTEMAELRKENFAQGRSGCMGPGYGWNHQNGDEDSGQWRGGMGRGHQSGMHNPWGIQY